MAKNSVSRTSGVYKITCITNGKIYIGSSLDIKKRWSGHQYDLRKNKHPNPHLQGAWNKYGEASFIFEVVELVMPWSRIDREQYWLDKLKPYDRTIGFNIGVKANSGTSGRKLSPEHIAKSAAAHRGRKQPREAVEKTAAKNRGRKHNPEFGTAISARMKGVAKTPEARAKMSIAKKGKKLSPEHIEKIRLASTGRKHSQITKEKIGNAHKGHKHSDKTKAILSANHKGKIVTNETRAKLSKIWKGRKHTPESKIKMGLNRWGYCYEVVSPIGEVFEVHNLSQFCKDHGLIQACMSKVSLGEQGNHKGWKVKRI